MVHSIKKQNVTISLISKFCRSYGTNELALSACKCCYVNVTRKIASPLFKESARAVVSSYVIWCVDSTSEDIASAFRIRTVPASAFGMR